MANTGAIRAGKAFVELGTNNAALERGLRAAEKRLKAFGAGLRSVGTKMFAAGAGVLAPLAGAAKAFASAGDTLDKMSGRTGVSVEALSELGFAAEQSGADLETLETGLRKMQRSIVDAAGGSQEAVESLAALGLSAEALRNLTPEQQFKLIADRLAGIADPTTRAALAMELLGKSGTRLLPMMQDGAKGIEALQQQARDFGLTISTQTAQDAALLTDTLNILWRPLKQGVITIGSALGPVIVELANKATAVVVRVNEWIGRNKALVVTVAKVAAAVAAAGAVLVAAGFLVSGLGGALGGLASVVKIGTAAFTVLGPIIGALVSPIGLVVAAVVGLGAAILTYADAGSRALSWLGDTFRWLKDGVLAVVGGIADALVAGDIALAAKVLWAGLKVAWETGIAPLRDVWNDFRFLLERTGVNAFAGLKKAWLAVSTWMWKNFPEVTAFIAKTWANLGATLRKVWAKFQNWLSDRWLEVMGMFDESLDVEAAQAIGRQGLQEQLGEIEGERSQAVAEAERKNRLTDQEHAAEQAAALAQVELERAEALARLNAAHEDRAQAAREALREAQAELADVRAQAQQAREQVGAGPAAPRRPSDALVGLDLDGLGTTLAHKMSVTGTFSAVAVAGLGGGRTEERIARATEDTAKNVKRIAERDGAIFT